MESPRLLKKYKEQVVPALTKEFNYTTPMQVPKLLKIVLNRGVGDATQDKKLVDHAVNELTLIAGQKAIPRNSRKNISNFKLRLGVPVGAKVTLRNEKMYEFLDRYINIVLPRVRDFRGIPVKGFDGQGNFNMGIKEQITFPEIKVDKVNSIEGLDIAFVTTAPTDEEALALLKNFGMPFQEAQTETV